MFIRLTQAHSGMSPVASNSCFFFCFCGYVYLFHKKYWRILVCFVLNLVKNSKNYDRKTRRWKNCAKKHIRINFYLDFKTIRKSQGYILAWAHMGCDFYLSNTLLGTGRGRENPFKYCHFVFYTYTIWFRRQLRYLKVDLL